MHKIQSTVPYNKKNQGDIVLLYLNHSVYCKLSMTVSCSHDTYRKWNDYLTWKMLFRMQGCNFWMEAIYLEKILLILWHLQGSNSQLTNRMEYGLTCHACRSKYNLWQNPYFLVSYVCQEVICLKIYILKNQLFFSISRWILNIFPICQFSVSRTCMINSSTEGSRPKHLCLSTVILTQTPFYL